MSRNNRLRQSAYERKQRLQQMLQVIGAGCRNHEALTDNNVMNHDWLTYCTRTAHVNWDTPPPGNRFFLSIRFESFAFSVITIACVFLGI